MEHFRLEQVGDDAWAAIAVDGGDAVGNAGFVIVDESAIVFDNFASLDAARELRIEAESQAPVAYAVNSHWHGDHVSGNPMFDDVPIVATERTFELMREHERGNGVLPGELFDERVELDGVVVETLGGGHTESDAFLWHGDVLFSGDLVVVESHPWVGHGDVEHWIEILDAFEARGPRVIVPGHGPVATAAAIPPLRRYLQGLIDGNAEAVPGWAFFDGHESNLEALRG